MQLSKIRIKNYRLLIDAELDVDAKTTLIVGRNNTAKTSCFECLATVLTGRGFSYDDYPLQKRDELYSKIMQFMEKKINYEELYEQLEKISLEFLVDYSLDKPEDNLGALSPFIIDVDENTAVAIIRAENRLIMDEKSLWKFLENGYYKDGVFAPDDEEVHDIISSGFNKMFEMSIYAINPNSKTDVQIKSHKELNELFPFYVIPAERTLGEDGSQNGNSLGKLISNYFDISEDELDATVAGEVKKLREIVGKANKDVQKRSYNLLSAIISKAVGFGYPNGEELQLGVTTKLKIDDQIKNQSILSYSLGKDMESLPSKYNGLGYKNLIKMEFMLAAFARDIEKYGTTCIPLLLIEEPESHMHPQMQHTFAEYLEKFLATISNVSIQTFLTSHSAHIANTMDFSKIRYAQKSKFGVVYKNLNVFAQNNAESMDFIKKYLTLSRCDLFFADKIIFVEGASERILLPDMIDKCDKNGEFGSQICRLPAQYYALIEIGGAYAYKFIPFADFLDIPCLILTDLDSVLNKKSVPVSQGETTSNATIKWWMRKHMGLQESDKVKIKLTDITSLSLKDKTRGKCHIEFQTEENGLCGHSLEEAIRNVNRIYYNLEANSTEENLEFKEKCKTDFALNLICDNPNYIIPDYIKSGLIWLNNQKVFE
ncbi:MAG: ATP-dependent endonuclease [Clostridia bacterium]|nr:ATP-dependent endonuclease [Clostridia bacterium]